MKQHVNRDSPADASATFTGWDITSQDMLTPLVLAFSSYSLGWITVVLFSVDCRGWLSLHYNAYRMPLLGSSWVVYRHATISALHSKCFIGSLSVIESRLRLCCWCTLLSLASAWITSLLFKFSQSKFLESCFVLKPFKPFNQVSCSPLNVLPCFSAQMGPRLLNMWSMCLNVDVL